MKRIRGILIDTVNHVIKEHTLVFEQAKEWYEHVQEVCKCDVLEVARRPFANVWADVYCDEMGTYRPIQTPAILMLKDGKVIEKFVNNCFICNHTKSGNVTSLTKREREQILTCKMDLFYRNEHIEVLRIDV